MAIFWITEEKVLKRLREIETALDCPPNEIIVREKIFAFDTVEQQLLAEEYRWLTFISSADEARI